MSFSSRQKLKQNRSSSLCSELPNEESPQNSHDPGSNALLNEGERRRLRLPAIFAFSKAEDPGQGAHAQSKEKKEGPHAAHQHAFPAGMPQMRFWAQSASGWHMRPNVYVHEMRVQGSCGAGARAHKIGQEKQNLKPCLFRRLFLFKDIIILEKKLV